MSPTKREETSQVAADASERGLTLTEVMIVLVIGSLVTLGLGGFYLSSQATWLTASSQAMAQRDATTLVEAIARETRKAGAADVDPTGHTLILRDRASFEQRSFWWDLDDSLVHVGRTDLGEDAGPVVSSTVEAFSLAIDDSLPLVHLQFLQLRGANGERVSIRSSIRMHNADP